MITAEEAVEGVIQHEQPCVDCPWRRKALNGWLGMRSSEEWLQAAHSETQIDCHTITNMQCAGSAIYRANVCKSPRFKEILQLPANRKAVFSSPMEFKAHHKKSPMK